MLKTIAIVGPESTGKTTLCRELSKYFDSPWLPEYARDYVGKISRRYTYADVEHIAQYQISELKMAQKTYAEKPFLFLDTDLIITKVWFDRKFGEMPIWLPQAVENQAVDFYLLCYPDVEWEPDPLRENGNCRPELYEQYRHEIEQIGGKYAVISGQNEARVRCAIEQIEKNEK